MRSRSAQSGDLVQFDRPEWRPLIALLGERLAESFMWMHEVRLAGGAALHAYKHAQTRRYLHLTFDGRVFGYLEGEYLPIETSLALMLVLPRHEWPEGI